MDHSTQQQQEDDSSHAKEVAEHYNSIVQGNIATRSLSRIFYMRNFNNWIKSQVIAQYIKKVKNVFSNESPVNIEVLDLCSGKGGDMLKWREASVHKVVFADIADVAVQLCQSRYNEMLERRNSERLGTKPLFQAEFHVADCTRDHLKVKYNSPAQKFHLVSSMFSFHYCFESLGQAERMIRNAAECLKVGGFFILTIPNANELVKRLRQAPKLEFGNSVYRVNFSENSNKEYLPVFGAQYHFYLEDVVNCPEFLVHLPVLYQLASRWGLRPVQNSTFGEFFEESVKLGDARALLGRMQSLEPHPPADGVNMMSECSLQYQSAKDHLKILNEAEPDKRHNLGTLSQDEWETASLYSVVVFKRVVEASPE